MELVFLILLLTTLVSNTTPLKMQERHLALCICSIFRQHFVSDQTLLLSNTEDADFMDFLLEKLHAISNWPLQVFSQGAMIPFQGEHQKIWNYLILSRGHEDIEEQTDKLTDNAGWTYEARFLVVVTVRGATPRQQALSVVQELWDNARVLNVVVLVQLDTVFHMYTWFPYQSRQQCEDVTDVVLINQWSLEGNTMVNDTKNLFENKAPKNLHGCPIRASSPDRKMPEIRYINMFSSRFNFTLDVQAKSESDGPIYERIKSSIMDLVVGSSEMAIGGMPLLIDIANVANPSVPYYEVLYAWYVPCARPLSRLQAISKIFPISLWVSLSATVLLVAVVLWALEKRATDSRAFRSLDIALYNVWAVVLGVAVTRMPRTYRLRVIIFAWICYSFSIATVFQTFFTSYLVDPGLEKQITSLDELLESEMEFGFRPEMTVYFEGSNNQINKYILAHRTECNHTTECIKRIITTASFATLAESWAVASYLTYTKGGSSVCLMNDLDTFPIKIVFYFRKGSILIEQFNNVLVSMIETGQIKSINVELGLTGYSVGDATDEDGRTDDYFVFTTAHLSVAFYTFFLGHILSVLLLLGEILYNKLKKGPHSQEA